LGRNKFLLEKAVKEQWKKEKTPVTV